LFGLEAFCCILFFHWWLNRFSNLSILLSIIIKLVLAKKYFWILKNCFTTVKVKLHSCTNNFIWKGRYYKKNCSTLPKRIRIVFSVLRQLFETAPKIVLFCCWRYMDEQRRHVEWKETGNVSLPNSPFLLSVSNLLNVISFTNYLKIPVS